MKMCQYYNFSSTFQKHKQRSRSSSLAEEFDDRLEKGDERGRSWSKRPGNLFETSFGKWDAGNEAWNQQNSSSGTSKNFSGSGSK